MGNQGGCLKLGGGRQGDSPGAWLANGWHLMAAPAPQESPHRAPWARRRCSILRQRLFTPCHDAVPCQHFYDWCVFDACG